jgi:ABC-type transporter Mla MlaB component
MGLFSFLKKKTDAPPAKAAARPRTNDAGGSPTLLGNPSTRMPLDTEAERERQREIARATAAKIDEIELQMASDIFDDEAWGSPRRAPAAVSAAVSALASSAAGESEIELNTDGLLGPEHLPDAAAAPSSAPVVEEAAILYANGQVEAAEQVLLASLADLGRSERQPWWMLFDLYQATAREQAFESIAIDYASHFETSPPAYKPLMPMPGGAGQPPASSQGGVSPTASLSGKLDANAGAQLARVLAPGPASAVVRLEFSAVAGATPEGCAVLLDALQALRRAGRELVLAGADHLVGVLRPMLAIGERTASQAPWLLLLELLLLLNREKDFEETAMDYCVTFEVSPPSFEPPAHAAISVGASPVAQGDRFLLPGAVTGNGAALLASIDAYAAEHDALVLDCSRLAHIDYAAAAALVTRLRQLAGAAHKVELRDLNHLVASLLGLLGAGEEIRLYAHKY